MSNAPVHLFVPRFGTLLRLWLPWTFDLHHESRNKGLLAAVGKPFNPGLYGDKEPKPIKITLPAFTVLKVDRVYIRRSDDGQASDYDSITFQIVECPVSKGLSTTQEFGRKTRFWAKMDDCNTIVAQIDDTRKINVPQPHKDATVEIKAGDLVKIDYASAKMRNHSITRDNSKRTHLVIGIDKDGAALLFNIDAKTIYDSELYTWYKDGVYVIQGHEDDVRERLLTWANKMQGAMSSRELTKSPDDFVDQFMALPQKTFDERWRFRPY